MSFIWVILSSILDCFFNSNKELEWAGEVSFTFKTANFVIIVSKYADDNSCYVNNARYIDSVNGGSEEWNFEPKRITLKKFCNSIESGGEHISYESLLDIVRSYSKTIHPTQSSGIPTAILYGILSKR